MINADSYIHTYGLQLDSEFLELINWAGLVLQRTGYLHCIRYKYFYQREPQGSCTVEESPSAAFSLNLEAVIMLAIGVILSCYMYSAVGDIGEDCAEIAIATVLISGQENSKAAIHAH